MKWATAGSIASEVSLVGVFVPLTDGVQAELVFDYAGQVLENRLWFTYDTPPFTSVELDSLAAGIVGWHTAAVLPYLSHELTLLRVQVTDWTTFGSSVTGFASASAVGGSPVAGHSANVAVVVPFRWPLGFRLKRNKHYVPGVPLDAVNLNTVSSAFVSAMFEAYAALIDAARFDFEPVLRWRWRVTSSYEGGSPRAEQLALSSQGPRRSGIILGQRRRRLP